MTKLSARAETLLALHHQPAPVVLPTVWDAWSARAAVEAGFEALTIGSHPLADSLGVRTDLGSRLVRAWALVPAAVDVRSGAVSTI